jgi:hypothetical protein
MEDVLLLLKPPRNKCRYTDLSLKELLVIRKAQKRQRQKQQERGLRLFRVLVHSILHNIPLSVLLDVCEHLFETTLDTVEAGCRLAGYSVEAIVSALCFVIRQALGIVARLNPIHLIKAILTMQKNAVGKTSEVLVSGIQSVATGVGSAGTAAIYRLASRGGGGAASGLGRSGMAGSSVSLKSLRPNTAISSEVRANSPSFGDLLHFIIYYNIM